MTARSTLLGVTALAFVLTACQPPAQEASALADEDLAAIRTLNEEIVQAGLADDWDAVAAFFTDDLVYMPPNLPVVEGREVWLARTKSIPFRLIEMTAEAVEIDGRDGLAYLRGAYTQTFTFEGAPEPIEDTGKWLYILRKEPDGSWRVATWIWNSDVRYGESGPDT